MNTTTALRAYFSTPERIVTVAEFYAFWRSLSLEERIYFRYTPLI